MTQVRYAIVYGYKDAADTFFPFGEFYLRGATLEQAKSLFGDLPKPAGTGRYVFRLFERYYDKHTEVDMNYKASEFTRETNLAGFKSLLEALISLQESALEN